jgi:hypothetical protein
MAADESRSRTLLRQLGQEFRENSVPPKTYVDSGESFFRENTEEILSYNGKTAEWRKDLI